MKYITLSLFSILILSVLVYFGLTYLKPTQSLTKIDVEPSQTQEISSGKIESSPSATLEEDLTALDRDIQENSELETEFNNDLKTI